VVAETAVVGVEVAAGVVAEAVVAVVVAAPRGLVAGDATESGPR
jgi:hypothetical protein